MRAKFKVDAVTRPLGDAPVQNVAMTAVTEAQFDADGKSEDNSFSRWTPTASLTMTISNPDLIGKISEGQKFYVDFTPAA